MSRLLKALALIVFLGTAGLGVFAAANWQPDRTVEELSERWAPPPSRFIPIAGMEVHIRDEGLSDGTPVVLLHGTGSSLHTWDGWTAELVDDYRVIRFDLPGFGLTGPDPDGDYSIENYAAFVLEVLDALGIERVVLAGNSLGGYVAWATTVLYPGRVDRLVLVDSSGYAFEPESVPIGFTLARMPVAKHLIRDVLPRSMVESSVKDVFGDPSRVTPELVDRYYDLTTRAGNRDALVSRLEQLRPGEMADRIGEIAVPTLILWGRKDGLIPVKFGERFDEDLRDSRLITWDDLGHVPQEEDPSRTVQPVKDFLADRQ